MQEVNLPRHVIEAFEERWARKLQQQAAAWRSTRSQPALSRTRSGIPVERRARRPRPAAVLAGPSGRGFLRGEILKPSW